MFAKLFETSVGQILVKSDTNEDGNPEVRIFFEPEGFGVCNVALSFDDNEKGWNDQERFFDSMGESEVTKIVENQLNQIFIAL